MNRNCPGEGPLWSKRFNTFIVYFRAVIRSYSKMLPRCFFKRECMIIQKLWNMFTPLLGITNIVQHIDFL